MAHSTRGSPPTPDAKNVHASPPTARIASIPVTRNCVTADVAYAIVRYADVTGDVDYLYGEGAEILFETTRFWMQRCTRDGDRLVLHTVMGPDEFHSHVDNNAFTNRMVRWHLERAAQVHARMAQTHPDALAALAERIGLAAGEADGWPMPRNRSSHPSIPTSG